MIIIGEKINGSIPIVAEAIAKRDSLAYITGGTAEHTLENEGKTISAGDYFFVDYGCLHGFQNCKNLTLINCLFLPETVDETLQGCRSFSQIRVYSGARCPYPKFCG